MPFRNPSGPLSTFTAAGVIDDFERKDPFVNLSSTTALVKATDWNKMFDAASRIQKVISQVAGGGIATYGSGDTESTPGNTTISYLTVTLSGSGGIDTITSPLQTVPAIFGTNPFQDLGFGMAHTLYRTPESGEKTNGVWYTRGNVGTGRINELMSKTQPLVSIYPANGDGSGRGYYIKVRNLTVGNSGLLVSDSFSRSGNLSVPLPSIGAGTCILPNTNWSSWTPVLGWNNNISTFYSRTTTNATSNWHLLLSSTLGDMPESGYALTSLPATTDCEIEFTYADYTAVGFTNSEFANAVGFGLRMGGDGRSFYGLLFGDHEIYASSVYGHTSCKLIKSTSYDYSTVGNTTASVVNGGTVVSYGEVFLTVGRRYRANITGSTFSIYEQTTSGGAFVLMTSVTVSGGPSSGKVGIFTMGKSSMTVYVPNGSLTGPTSGASRAHWFDSLSIKSIVTSSTTNYTVNVLYAGIDTTQWLQADNVAGAQVLRYVYDSTKDIVVPGWTNQFTGAISVSASSITMTSTETSGTKHYASCILRVGQYGGSIDLSQANYLSVEVTPGTGALSTLGTDFKVGFSQSSVAGDSGSFLLLSSQSGTGALGANILTVDLTKLSVSARRNIRSIYIQAATGSVPATVAFGPMVIQ